MTRKISTGCRLVVSASLLLGFGGLTACASGGEAETASGGSAGAAGAAGSGGTGNGGSGGSAASGGVGGSAGTSTAGAGGSVGGSGGAGGSAGFAGAGGSVGGSAGVGGLAGAAGASAAGAAGAAGTAGTAGTGGSSGQPEICDGLDNDGNGQVDEGNPGGGGSCTVSGEVGECAKGTLNCVAAQLRCQPDSTPSSELCDGLDNDCDGQIDEQNPEGGASCQTGLDGICSAGTTRCDTTGTPVRVVCDPVAQPGSISESCNSIDDDCDGVVDNGNPGGGVSCSVSGRQGPCAAGISDCQAGQLACIQQTFPVSETCDGIDNDCDGALDNAPVGQTLPGVGDGCSVGGAQGQCAIGTQTCAGGGFVCNPTFTSRDESCDGLDNDCNGSVDNGNALTLCTRRCIEQGLLLPGQTIMNAPTFQCTGGACEFNQSSCPAGRVDGNGNYCDGCESTVCTTKYPNSCSSPQSLTGSDSGAIINVGGASYFSVSLNKPNPNTNKSWNPSIILSAASVTNGYRMDVLSNCSTTATCPVSGGSGSATTATNVTQWSMNYAALRGTCGAPNGPCTDNSSPPGTMLIRIRRVSIPSSGANPECAQFTVTFNPG